MMTVRLDGVTALVAGGTGSVGREIVRAFLGAGATRVLVTSRRREDLDRLRQHLGADAVGDRFVPLVGDLSSAEGLDAVRAQARSVDGGLDAVVASLNSRAGWGKPLVDTGDEAWRQVIEGGLTLHFRVARALLPLLAGREGASYTFVNGGLAESPTRGVGPVCASAAGQLMLARVLAAEAGGSGVRVNTLLVNSVVREGERNDRADHPERVTGSEVGHAAAFLVSGHAAIIRGAVVPINQMPPVRPDVVDVLRRRQAAAPA